MPVDDNTDNNFFPEVGVSDNKTRQVCGRQGPSSNGRESTTITEKSLPSEKARSKTLFYYR